MKAQIWVDDWIVAVALLIATGFFVNAIVWQHQGFGNLGEEITTTYVIHFFTEELLFFIIIGLAKFSILAFYWRLFTAPIRIPCYILGAITICWEIAVILFTVFQCVPVSGFWNHKIHAKCINEKDFFLGSLAPDISIDIALLLLPVPYIWSLHMTTSQKTALAFTFMLGGFITVISIIRITLLLELDLHSSELGPIIKMSIWSIGESNLAIVAACLPSLRPIQSLILYGEPSPSVRATRRKVFSRFWTRIQPSAVVQAQGQPTSPSDSQQNFMPLPDEAYGFSDIEQVHGTAITSSGKRGTHDDEDIEMQTGGLRAKNGIQVRSDVTVRSIQK